MKVRQIMTNIVESVDPDTPVAEAAARMRDRDIGSVLVVEAGRVAGIVTDRDIAIRLVPSLEPADRVPVSRIMSRGVHFCYVDQDVATIAGIMGDYQVRRLPVLDDREQLVGVVSLEDIAEHASEHIAGEALGEIVEER
jgi:CBS domain-containing protein